MSGVPYPYNQRLSRRYVFTSLGKRTITKVVEFTPTSEAKIFNLGFGDLLPNGMIDDRANSNNGDIIKVFSTIIQIVKDFTHEFTDVKIVFTGSTVERTTLYNRILNSYFETFAQDFVITALIQTSSNIEEVEFEANSNKNYLVFFIQRIR